MPQRGFRWRPGDSLVFHRDPRFVEADLVPVARTATVQIEVTGPEAA
jgi:hypothetical protein